MKIESTGFSRHELAGFLDEVADHERRVLADRLDRASARLLALAERLPDEPAAAGSDPVGWTAREVLAHIAVLSKFYGVVGYRVGTGATSQLDLLAQVQQRDVFGERMAALPAAELVAAARAEHRRTLAWLESASPADLRRRCDLGDGISMTAEEVVRLPLCAHLELHLDQLEASLGDSSSA